MKMRKAHLTVGAVALVLSGPPQAFAVQTEPSPLIIDQGRADRRPPLPRSRLEAPAAQGGAKTAIAAITPFIVREVRLEGSTAPARLMRSVFLPFVGRRLDQQGLSELTQKTAAAYANTGIALYTIVLPNQTFADGVVRLRAVEGYVSKITVKNGGGAARDLALVRRFAQPVVREHPLRSATLQRTILLIRDIPGLTADVQLLRGGADGAVELALAVKRKRFEAGVGLNNRGTEALGRTQAEVDLTANSLLRPGDQTRLTLAAPTSINEFQYYALSHSELLNASGLTASASLGYLMTRPQALPVRGSAETASFALSYPVIRDNKQALFVTGSFDGVNSDNALYGDLVSRDHTRALRAAAAYNRAFRRTTLSAALTASFGLDGLGARVTSPLLSDKTFKKVNARVALDQRIGDHWTVRLRGAGQYSGDRLPAVEQFALGG